MITSKSVPLLLVATVSSLVGYSIGRPPQLPALTLEHVKITQIHPAALYVRDLRGQERRYLIDGVDAGWARSLAEFKGKRCFLELKPSNWCANRYTVSTVVEETGLAE
jgi:hypothetical protein